MDVNSALTLFLILLTPSPAGVPALGGSEPQRGLRGCAAAAPQQLPAVLPVQLPAGLVGLVGPGHLRLPPDR